MPCTIIIQDGRPTMVATTGHINPVEMEVENQSCAHAIENGRHVAASDHARIAKWSLKGLLAHLRASCCRIA